MTPEAAINAARRLWKDPVASKILGSLGYTALCVIGGGLYWALVRGNWTAFPIIAAALVEVTLIWVTLRKPSLIITADSRARHFPRRTRRVAGILAAILPIVAPALGWAVALTSCRQENRTSVLVANFETDPQAAHYRVTRTIFEHLRSALSEFPDVVPELVGRSVPWDKDPTSILTWCQKQRRAVLIWGDFDTTQSTVIVTAHFQLLRAAKEPLRGWNERRAALGELESFTIQDDLARQCAYGVLLAVGITRFENSDFDSAISRLTAAIGEGGGRSVSPALFYRGRSYIQTGQYETAIADFSSILGHDPKYPYALNNRGASYVAVGDYQAGYADLSRAISIQPSDPLAYVNRGSALYKLQKLDEALDDFNHAIRLAPRDPLAYEGRANVYDRLGAIDKALADYDAATRLDGNDPMIYFNRAIALHAHGREELAINDMGRALLLQPSVSAYEYRAHLLLRTGRRGEAVSDYRSALRIARSPSDRLEVEGRLRELGEKP